MKLNKKWIAIILLVVMALCLTACGEKKEEAAKPTLVGVWEMDKATLLDYTGISEEYYAEAKAEFGYIALTVEFKADGKYFLYEVTGEDKEVMFEGTYTVDGSKITLNGSSGTYKIEGTKLTLTEDATSTPMVFNRK